jgi:transcription elongation factor GreA
MKKTYPITKEGLEDKKNEYEQLQQRRVEAVKELSIARDMGDRSENAAYKSARWKLSGIDRQLRYLKNVIANAKVVEPAQEGIVGIGAKVKLRTEDKEVEYKIVGGHESDISKGYISFLSPIGKALMRKKVGDVVEVSVPAGRITYSVESIF